MINLSLSQEIYSKYIPKPAALVYPVYIYTGDDSGSTKIEQCYKLCIFKTIGILTVAMFVCYLKIVFDDLWVILIAGSEFYCVMNLIRQANVFMFVYISVSTRYRPFSESYYL